MQDIVTGTPPHLIGGAIRCGGEATAGRTPEVF
jgi:hypothetical protein